MIQRYAFLFIFFSLISCKIFDSPTNTEPNDLFKLSITYNNERITDALAIPLSWSEITIDNFKEIKISRFNDHRDSLTYLVGETVNGWITVANISNEFATSYVDTVTDDAPFRYRVEYYDNVNNYRRAEELVTIRPTTHLTIPDDQINVKTAVESYIIDNGDSVLIKPGIHSSFAFSFDNKNINLIGLAGAQKTQLIWRPTLTESEKMIHDSTFIKVKHGLVQGLTIQGGYAYHGGGINATGSAIIKQCRIKNNHAGILYNGGLGGGLYLSGDVTVSNCIIDSNSADYKGHGIYIDGSANNVNIVNCTFSGNNLFNSSPNVIIENSIFNYAYSGVDLQSYPLPVVKHSYAGTYWSIQDTTNISGELLLDEYFYLLPGSVCIDFGNPDSAYNDPDGSRNDIGAYGGPLGNW